MFIVSFIRTLFHWPDGIVVGNLIASVLWVPFTLIHIKRHNTKKLAEQTQELHDHIEQHLARQTEELKTHVSSEINNNAG